MIIACDVDDVCADLVPAWLEWYNRDYDDNLKPDDITSWDMSKFVRPECGNGIYSYLEMPALYDSVLPVPLALNSIQTLRDSGCRVVFVTSATIGSAGRKLVWLQAHGFLERGKTTSHDYVECSDKSLICADWLVDDNPENIANFYGAGILLDKPWNRSAKVPLRAFTWIDVLTTVLGGKYVANSARN